MRDTPALDGMRGVAALLVVGFHVVLFAVELPMDGRRPEEAATPLARGFLDWGFIGVDFFFVLSAFLLSQPFLVSGLRQDWRDYAVKRLVRVVPAYYASLVLAAVLVGRSDHWWFAWDSDDVWRHLLFVHGFWQDTQWTISPVYWTLAVELQFYLLLPILAIPFRGRRWPLALAAALALTLAYRVWAHVPGDGAVTIFREQQLPAFLWHFALGITMARIRQQVRNRSLPPAALDGLVLAAIAAFIVAPSAWFGAEATSFGHWTPTYIMAYRTTVAAGFALAILFVCAGPGRIAGAMQSPPFALLGSWSYSLYLTHYAAGAALVLAAPRLLELDLASLTFVIAAFALVLAGVFHALVEAPALRLKASIARGLSRRGLPDPPIGDGPKR